MPSELKFISILTQFQLVSLQFVLPSNLINCQTTCTWSCPGHAAISLALWLWRHNQNRGLYRGDDMMSRLAGHTPNLVQISLTRMLHPVVRNSSLSVCQLSAGLLLAVQPSIMLLCTYCQCYLLKTLHCAWLDYCYIPWLGADLCCMSIFTHSLTLTTPGNPGQNNYTCSF